MNISVEAQGEVEDEKKQAVAGDHGDGHGGIADEQEDDGQDKEQKKDGNAHQGRKPFEFVVFHKSLS